MERNVLNSEFKKINYGDNVKSEMTTLKSQLMQFSKKNLSLEYLNEHKYAKFGVLKAK